MQILYHRRHRFQQPLGSGGRSAHAHIVVAAEPVALDLIGAHHPVGADVHALAEPAQHLSVGALAAAHEHYYIVAAGKAHQLAVPVRNLPADGVVDRQQAGVNHFGGQPFAELVVLHRALGGLGENLYAARGVQPSLSHKVLELSQVLHHKGIAVHLAHQAQHLRMANLAENHYLSVRLARMQLCIRLADALLYPQHHRAGKIQHLEALLLRQLIRRRRLTVGPDQESRGGGGSP